MPDIVFSAESDYEGLTAAASYGDVFSAAMSAPTSPKSCSETITTPATSGRVKRPMNPFMVWAKQERPRLAQQQPGVHNAELSRLLGERWRKMTDAEKRPYRAAATQLADEHKRNHPDYKYRPRKKDPAVRRVRGRRIKREDISRAVRSMTKEQISAYVGLVLGDDDDEAEESESDEQQTAANVECKPVVNSSIASQFLAATCHQPSASVKFEPARVVPTLASAQQSACTKCIGACECMDHKPFVVKPEGHRLTAWKETTPSCLVDAVVGNLDLNDVLLMPNTGLSSESQIDVKSSSKPCSTLGTPEVDLVDWLDGLVCASTANEDLVPTRWSLSSCASSPECFSSSVSSQPSPDFSAELKFSEWL